MIDWLKIRVQIDHDSAVHGDHIWRVKTNGDTVYQIVAPLRVAGSHDSTISVQSDRRDGKNYLIIDGNPSKFLQGHNLFGSDDVCGLAAEMTEKVCALIGIHSTQKELEQIGKGNFEVRKIDVNYGWHLDSRDQVKASIRGLSQTATLQNRGRGSLTKESTCYWGKNSRRSALKCYSKGDEIEAPKHKLPEELAGIPSLRAFADTLLRFEVRLLGMELDRMGLYMGYHWNEDTPKLIHAEMMEKLDIPEKLRLTAAEIESLPSHLQAPYQLWLDGHDLREKYSRATYYRHRKQLAEFGINVDALNDRPADNVIPITRILQAVPAPVPDWAVGTPLYFEPRQYG